MRKVGRHSLVTHNKATWCEVVGYQKEHLVPEAGWFGAFESCIPSVGGDCDEAGC